MNTLLIIYNYIIIITVISLKLQEGKFPGLISLITKHPLSAPANKRLHPQISAQPIFLPNKKKQFQSPSPL